MAFNPRIYLDIITPNIEGSLISESSESVGQPKRGGLSGVFRAFMVSFGSLI